MKPERLFPTRLAPSVYILAVLLAIIRHGGLHAAEAPAQAPPANANKTAPFLKNQEWHKNNLAGAYQRVGKHNVKWDTHALKALDETAMVRSLPYSEALSRQKKVFELCQPAVTAGCDDPLILYLHARYAPQEDADPEKLADQFGECADRLRRSEYPAINKLWADLQAVDKMQYVYSRVSPKQDAHFYRQSALTNVLALLADKAVPNAELADACLGFLQAAESNPSQTHRPEWSKIRLGGSQERKWIGCAKI